MSSNQISVGTNAGIMQAGGHNVAGNVHIGPTKQAQPPPAARAPRLLFMIDVVGYGRRSAPAREDVQERLRALLRRALEDADLDLAGADDDGGTGDGIAVCLPVGADPTRAVPGLLESMLDGLARDNDRYRDRIRLRMALGFGTVGRGPTGFTGQLIVELGRLTDSQPLREAVERNPDRDLLVLVTNALYEDVIMAGYLRPRLARFVPVDVESKEYAGRAWLWVSPAAAATG
jgi:hypothetical protein